MGPVHGTWCNAVTWSTKCPRCNASVFFFQCDHGSKVFFDELGEPWPIHDCDTAWAKSLQRSQDDNGVTVEISDGITIRRPSEDFSVHRNIIQKAKERKSKPHTDPIIAVKPEGNSGLVTIIGVLREKTVNADPEKFLKIDGSPTMVTSALGVLGKDKWYKLTVHEPSASKNIQHSYTFWAKSSQANISENSKGVTVLAEIEPFEVLGAGIVWLCTQYKVLG